MRCLRIFLLILILIGLQTNVWANEAVSVANGNDRVCIRGDLNITEKTSDNVVAVWGNVNVQEDIDGDVVSVFGNSTINSRVSGDVATIFGKLTLTDKAVVEGEVVTIGTLEKVPGAKVYGQETNISTSILLVARIIMIIFIAFLVLVLGIVIVAIFRGKFHSIALGFEYRTRAKIIIGILGFIGLTLLMILLAFTVIAPIIYMFLLLVAEVVAAIYLGKKILTTFKCNLSIFVDFLVGLIALSILKILLTLMISYIGIVIYIITYAVLDICVWSWGLGILIDTKFGATNDKGSSASYPIKNYIENENLESMDNNIFMEDKNNDKLD